MAGRESLFPFLRRDVALRARSRTPGVRFPFDSGVVSITLEDAQHLLRIVEAAVEAANYRMFTTSGHPKSHHIVDRNLWETIYGRDWREKDHAKGGSVVDV
jgi:hypothetical protein